MTDDAQSVCDNAKFKDIAKMPIDIKLLDNPVSILRIILGYEYFNAGRIKDGHICFHRVNRLADRLGNINMVIENELQII